MGVWWDVSRTDTDLWLHHCIYLSAGFNDILEIRVGQDGERLGNNQICAEELDLTVSGAANIACLRPLFGDWISVNKSSTLHEYYHLVLAEVRVFGGKYSSAPTTHDLSVNYLFDIIVMDFDVILTLYIECYWT